MTNNLKAVSLSRVATTVAITIKVRASLELQNNGKNHIYLVSKHQ